MNARHPAFSMSRGRQYVLGTAFGLVAALMRYALIPIWGTKYPFFTFYPAVMLAAWYGGSGAGFAGLAVASIGAWYFIEPVGFVPMRWVGDVLAWALFVTVNLVILVLVEATHRERRRAEAARDGARISAEQLRTADETRARLAAIVESSTDAIISKTLDGIVISWNSGAERIFGYRAEEMIGQPIARLVPPDRPDEEPTILNTIRRGERVEHYEAERVCKDGRRIHVSLSVSPITDAAGQIIGASKIARDVTERKQAEERFRQNQDRTRRLLEFNQAVMANMGEGLYTVDPHGLLTFMNPAAERIFGWSTEELSGKKMHETTHSRHPDGTGFPADECAGLQVLKTGVPLTNHEDVFIRRDGSFFPVTFSASPITSDGAFTGLVVVFRDVTRDKHAASEREELLAGAERARAAAEAAAAAERGARQLAEAANRAKDAFLATISHELRTPLSPILMWARLLRQSDLSAERARHGMEVIERCARSQAQLIEDLLDVSRIVAGKMRLEVRPVMLAPVIERAVDVVRPAAEAKSVRLQTVLDSEVGAVLGDAERLQQVVWNLLSNAVKFTPKGGRVQVALERVNSHVEIAVSDSGQGIEPEFLGSLFERFQQADKRTTRTHGGLGLGLSIVRHITEAHGGTVIRGKSRRRPRGRVHGQAAVDDAAHGGGGGAPASYGEREHGHRRSGAARWAAGSDRRRRTRLERRRARPPGIVRGRGAHRGLGGAGTCSPRLLEGGYPGE